MTGEIPIERFVEAPDHTRLYLRQTRGEGLTAVLSDGIACDGFIWKYLWGLLAERMPVAHWHYRGHGRSAQPNDEHAVDIPTLGHDLGAIRSSIGSPPVVLFGHSMGCQVVLEHCLQQPDGVRGLVLLCGSHGRITETFRGTNLLAQVLPKVLERVERAPDMARALWSRIPHDVALRIALLSGEVNPRVLKPEDLLPYLQHMTHIDLPMFLRMLRAAGEHSARDRLSEIKCPVLVVAGEKDLFTPPYLAEEMAKLLPSADFFLVEGATHVAPLEQRDLVHQAILRFLKERVA